MNHSAYLIKIYIYIYIYTYTHTHTYIHTHIHTYIMRKTTLVCLIGLVLLATPRTVN